MRRVLTENEILDQNTMEIEWPERLETEMSEYDGFMLLMGDQEEASDYLSVYCNIQRPEYYKMH